MHHTYAAACKHIGAIALLAAILGGCGSPAYREGLEAVAAGRKEEGLAHLTKATAEQPRNPEIRAAYLRTRDQTIEDYLAAAERQVRSGQPAAAEATYLRILSLDGRNTRALQGLEQLKTSRRNDILLGEAAQFLKKGDLLNAERSVRIVRAQDPMNATARRLQEQIDQVRESEMNAGESPAIKAALAKPVTLEFRDASLKSVFEVLSRSAGINFVFDKDVKGDAKITVFFRNSPLQDVVRLILSTNQLEKRQLNSNSFLIYPNTPAKAKEHQELVVRTFYLSNSDVKQAQNLVKTVAKSKDVFADEKLNMLIVKDTPDAIRLIERLIESFDLAEPEVMLEVEVLEVTRNRLQQLGVDWPDSIGLGRLTTDTATATTSSGTTVATTTTFGGALTTGYVDAQRLSGLTTFIANPAFTLNILAQNGDTNVLANPRIRVKNREKAKIHIGDKLPVFTTTSTANVGVSASVNYLDVGLKLDVEPNVTLDDEVSIKVALEVSSIVKEITGPTNSLAYQIGTRAANTVLRLKDGETQVLAGLISDEMRRSTSHVPGLGEIPVLGYAFGSMKDTSVKTEIILLITPRVLRNIQRPDFAAPAIPSGTETAVGAPPLTIKAQGPRGVGGSPRSGAGVGATLEARPFPVPVLEPEAPSAPAAPAVEPLSISGPPEANVGSEFTAALSAPGQTQPLSVDIAYDSSLVEAVSPSGGGTGRVSARVDQGQGAVRFRVLPNAKGETNIAVVGANFESGEPFAGAAAAFAIKLR